MANTLKFGAGKWATGNGTALAYNDENNNFKPLPFTFDRASTATVVNKSGLIETAATDVPRIDFLNNTKGALLLEPSRTNLITYSQDFSQWSIARATLEADAITSPDGGLTYKLKESTDTGSHPLFFQGITVSASLSHTMSVFVKEAGRSIFRINLTNGGSATYFNLSTETVTSGTGNIENYGNGWYRCSTTFTTSGTNQEVYIEPVISGTTASYTGDGVSGLYIYGTQLEAGSYATSYIPTTGSAVTRLADSCSQTPRTGVIGQTEGTVYVDFLSVNNFDGDVGNLFEIKEDNNNRINIYFSSGTPRLFGIENSSGLFNQALSLTTGSVCKLAVKYNSTATKVFINGSLSHTLTGITNIAFADLSILANNNINYNELILSNTALTDAEAITLTTL